MLRRRVLRHLERHGCLEPDPPFSSGRLGRLDEQNLVYNLPRPTQDGRSVLVMDPLQLLARLAALIPPPRTHLVRYFGVLAPSAALREQVISSAGPSAALMEQLSNATELMGLQSDSDPGGRGGVRLDSRLFS